MRPRPRVYAWLRVCAAVRTPGPGRASWTVLRWGDSDHERREWLAAFWGELAQDLSKMAGHQDATGAGGTNITIEKAVSR
ncbi:MAG: hypothetical protein PHS80_08695 [Methanothrix sp.]|nr:hypothetical protein [Methanothrix sp.]MDD4446354.1 hypothetical protein [Methanothrix sp.]